MEIFKLFSGVLTGVVITHMIVPLNDCSPFTVCQGLRSGGTMLFMRWRLCLGICRLHWAWLTMRQLWH